MTMTTRATGVSLAQWMTQNSGGGKNSYVKDWKERGFIQFWLHPTAQILSVYRHPFVRIYAKEDRTTQVKTREVQFDPLVCFEEENVLDSMYRRDRATGRREVPPVVCPICLMQEHLTQLVHSGKLDWRRPLFKFEGTDARKTRLYHVGGFTGLFADKQLPPEKLAELSGAESTDPAKRALQVSGNDPWFPASKWFGPVYQAGENAAFKQNAAPKQEFALTVVDHDNVAAGASIMFAGKSMGNKVIAVIAKAIKEARGPSDPDGQRGDPQRHPYVIRVEYNEQMGKRNPNDYYDALKMGGIPMTAAVHVLLSAPPPDLAKLAARPNLMRLRASLEEHMLVKLPLDAYFERALKIEAAEKASAPPESPEPAIPEVGRNPGSIPLPMPAPPQPPVPEEDMFACDTPTCGAPMRAQDTVCGKCGRRYDVEAAPPPPPPALRPRSSVGGNVAAPAFASPAAVPPPAAIGGYLDNEFAAPEVPAPAGGGSWPGDPSDDIPF